MDERIEQILRNFNFRACREHMLHVNWTWGMGVNATVPSVRRLMQEAKRLLEQAAESERPNTSVSCGGFHAHKWAWDAGEELELIFSVESWDEA